MQSKSKRTYRRKRSYKKKPKSTQKTTLLQFFATKSLCSQKDEIELLSKISLNDNKSEPGLITQALPDDVLSTTSRNQALSCNNSVLGKRSAHFLFMDSEEVNRSHKRDKLSLGKFMIPTLSRNSTAAEIPGLDSNCQPGTPRKRKDSVFRRKFSQNLFSSNKKLKISSKSGFDQLFLPQRNPKVNEVSALNPGSLTLHMNPRKGEITSHQTTEVKRFGQVNQRQVHTLVKTIQPIRRPQRAQSGVLGSPFQQKGVSDFKLSFINGRCGFLKQKIINQQPKIIPESGGSPRHINTNYQEQSQVPFKSSPEFAKTSLSKKIPLMRNESSKRLTISQDGKGVIRASPLPRFEYLKEKENNKRIKLFKLTSSGSSRASSRVNNKNSKERSSGSQKKISLGSSSKKCPKTPRKTDSYRDLLATSSGSSMELELVQKESVKVMEKPKLTIECIGAGFQTLDCKPKIKKIESKIQSPEALQSIKPYKRLTEDQKECQESEKLGLHSWGKNSVPGSQMTPKSKENLFGDGFNLSFGNCSDHGDEEINKNAQTVFPSYPPQGSTRRTFPSFGDLPKIDNRDQRRQELPAQQQTIQQGPLITQEPNPIPKSPKKKVPASHIIRNPKPQHTTNPHRPAPPSPKNNQKIRSRIPLGTPPPKQRFYQPKNKCTLLTPLSTIDDFLQKRNTKFLAMIHEMLRKGFNVTTKDLNFQPSKIVQNNPDLNFYMRAKVTDWMREAGSELGLRRQTIHAAISLLDRYLEKIKNFKKEELQLLALGCLLIASKFEEVEAPSLRNFSYMSNFAFSVEEIMKMEQTVCKELSWKLMTPTYNTIFGAISEEWDYFLESCMTTPGFQIEPNLKRTIKRLYQTSSFFRFRKKESYVLFCQASQILDTIICHHYSLSLNPVKIVNSILLMCLNKSISEEDSPGLEEERQDTGSPLGLSKGLDEDLLAVFNLFVNQLFQNDGGYYELQMNTLELQFSSRFSDLAFYYGIPIGMRLKGQHVNHESFEDFLSLQTHVEGSLKLIWDVMRQSDTP